MEYTSFDELFASLDVSLAHSRMVIAAPDENSVEVAAMVQREGIADPLFTGNRALIEKKFSGKKAGVLEMNKQAYDKGLEMGKELRNK